MLYLTQGIAPPHPNISHFLKVIIKYKLFKLRKILDEYKGKVESTKELLYFNLGYNHGGTII
jgi:hypothetical protein